MAATDWNIARNKYVRESGMFQGEETAMGNAWPLQNHMEMEPNGYTFGSMVENGYV